MRHLKSTAGKWLHRHWPGAAVGGAPQQRDRAAELGPLTSLLGLQTQVPSTARGPNLLIRLNYLSIAKLVETNLGTVPINVHIHNGYSFSLFPCP